MAQRKYCKNTVSGRQGRGKKYPAKVRAEVVMAMIGSNSICAVARKYGVPESTIRSWMAEEAGKPDGVFAEARAQAAREIAARAALGARAQVGYLQQRVAENQRRTRVFIPSTIFDNPALLKNDPGYLNNLASLPEAEKQALLYGSWDSFSGQVFTEWRNDPAHYEDQRWTHVIKPFRIPVHWKIWRGYDFGYSRPFSVGWYAADEDGRLYRIKELYGCTGTPNEGLKIDPVEQARRIREAEENDPMLKGRVIQGVADPAIFNESQGESIAQMQEKHPYYLVWHPGDHTRLAGKMQMHYRLAFNAEGRPMLQVFDTCKHFIRTIPNLVYDESNVEDIDSDQEDHIYDECRYVLMENPLSPRQIQKETALRDDPLDLDKRKSRTHVMRV